MLLQNHTAFSLPHLYSLSVSGCLSCLAFLALWSLQRRPQCKRVHLPLGRPLETQAQRESRPGQCAVLLELVMDKVSAVLRPSAPVGARDHDSVCQLWLTELVKAVIITNTLTQA